MPGMTTTEIDAFLDEPRHLLRLGTVDAAGMPSVVPIWFLHRDNKIWFTPRARSEWFEHIRANPQVCCTIDESSSPMRKVIARGHAEIVHDVGHDDVWRDMYREITMRYVPDDFGEAYLADTHDEPRALLHVDLSAARIDHWRMPDQPNENPLAVWAPKYYHRRR